MLIVMHAGSPESDLVLLCKLIACPASIASGGFILCACQQDGISLGAGVSRAF